MFIILNYRKLISNICGFGKQYLELLKEGLCIMVDKYNIYNDKIKRKIEKIFWSNVNNENEIYGVKKRDIRSKKEKSFV